MNTNVFARPIPVGNYHYSWMSWEDLAPDRELRFRLAGTGFQPSEPGIIAPEYPSTANTSLHAYLYFRYVNYDLK